MDVMARITAAIAHLNQIAAAIENGIEHDFEIVAQNIHGLLHYGDEAKLVSSAPDAGAPETKAE